MVVLAGGAYSSTTITPVGGGLYDCTIVGTKIAGTASPRVDIGVTDTTTTVTGAAGLYVNIYRADLRVTNVGVNIPAYQRIAAATDYDTTGFPYYLRFDGTDDFLVTGTINPGSVDKVQVFAGARKLSDASQVIAEFSATIASNPGAFNLYNFTDGKIYYESKGTILRFTGSNANTSPYTAVVSGISDISGDLVTFRENGVQISQNTGDQGTGNYLSYPLYIGRRGGTSLPFNGQLYSLIVRFGANLPDATIAQTETWVNGKTGAY